LFILPQHQPSVLPSQVVEDAIWAVLGYPHSVLDILLHPENLAEN
jgi:hypothetical protein